MDAYRPSESMRIADWLEARLRLLDGFMGDELLRLAGESAMRALRRCFENLASVGVILWDGEHIRLSERGLQLHSEVVVQCLVALEAALGPASKLPVKPWPFAVTAPGS
jgi:hypothetical protein